MSDLNGVLVPIKILSTIVVHHPDWWSLKIWTGDCKSVLISDAKV